MTTIEADAAAPEATPATPEPEAAAAATLNYLDPRALAANPANVRRDLGDLSALVASIRSVGVLEPLIVIPDGDGGHLIVAGHRRNAGGHRSRPAAGAVPGPARPGRRPRHRPGGRHAGRERATPRLTPRRPRTRLRAAAPRRP